MRASAGAWRRRPSNAGSQCGQAEAGWKEPQAPVGPLPLLSLLTSLLGVPGFPPLHLPPILSSSPPQISGHLPALAAALDDLDGPQPSRPQPWLPGDSSPHVQGIQCPSLQLRKPPLGSLASASPRCASSHLGAPDKHLTPSVHISSDFSESGSCPEPSPAAHLPFLPGFLHAPY